MIKRMVTPMVLIGLTMAACAPAPEPDPTPVATEIARRQMAQSVMIEHEVKQPGQDAYTVETELEYWLYLPEAYGEKTNEAWPLVLFLHGRGESDGDLEIVLRNGPPKMAEAGEDFPFIMASPQCSMVYTWADVPGLLKGLIDHLTENYAIDADRIIVTGLSMGGLGTWALSAAYPDLPAAIAPVAGFYFDPDTGYIGAVPENICELADIPTWAFHGDADNVVSLEYGQVIIEALEACGGDVTFTIYEGADHAESWERAYADPALYEWMMAQRRK
ncbi:MAG: dienelactone hydrolase family protein [Anaerolineae bacterium]|nr:dienelactone hydrolase family protein [Anaerolineae bacterium]